MSHEYKQKLEFKIEHAKSNLRYLILQHPDDSEKIEDIKKQITRYKNELEDYVSSLKQSTHTRE